MKQKQKKKAALLFFDFLEKNFSGSVGLVRAQGEYGHRDFYLWQLKYNQEVTNWLKLFVTGSGYHNEFVLDSRLKSECENHRESLIAERTDNIIFFDCEDVTKDTPLTRQFEIKDFGRTLSAYFANRKNYKVLVYGDQSIYPIHQIAEDKLTFSLPDKLKTLKLFYLDEFGNESEALDISNKL